jgi:transcriptional antiterminator
MIPEKRLKHYVSKITEALSNSAPDVTMRELAAMTGISRETIRRVIHEAKIDFSFGKSGPTKGYTQAYRDEIAELKQQVNYLKDSFVELSTKNADLLYENMSLKSENEMLKAALKISQTPWYKKIFNW